MKTLQEKLTAKTNQFKEVVRNTKDELELLRLKNIVKDAIYSLGQLSIDNKDIPQIESELRLRLRLVNTQLLMMS